MFKFKNKKSQQEKNDEQKKCEEKNGDSCPMCVVSDDIVSQLKGEEKNEDKNE